MITLFFILFFLIFGNILGFAFKAAWGIFRIVLSVVFLPLIILGFVFGGLMTVAFPLLLIVGICSLAIRRC